MPLPPGHDERGRRALTPRERRLLTGVGALVLVLVIAVVVSVAVSGPRSANGCIHATYAGPVGAGQVNACGAQARALCASLGTPRSGVPAPAAQTIAAECRKAGLPARG